MHAHLSEKDLKGNWILLYFGYTSSPDVGLAEPLQEIGEQVLKVQNNRLEVLNVVQSNLESMELQENSSIHEVGNCLIANRVPLLSFEWCSVLRRHPGGGVESSQIDALNAIIGNVLLMDNCDSWQWSPDVVVGYSVASARSLVDDIILETDLVATRWNHNIPIKVNVFLWGLNLNKLPSRLAKDLWSLLAKWWEVDIPICANISDWYDWLEDVRVPAKARSILEGTGGLSCGIFGTSETT
ncbi:hypothetical protein Tco_0103713 [Tanacetum coccineum]